MSIFVQIQKMQKKKSGVYWGVSVFLVLLAYPLLYYVYKYYSPDFGGRDFYFYYPLYKHFDVAHTEAPFNMRLISSFFVFVFSQLGIYYDTMVHYKNLDIDQTVFFNAILVNWLAVLITCFLIFRHLFTTSSCSILLPLLMSIFYLFSFGTILFCISPNTDGFSIMLITICFLMFKEQSNLVLLFYPLLLFQREFAFIILGILSLYYYYQHPAAKRYYLMQFLLNVCFFMAYYGLRKTLFYTPLYSNQISESGFMHSLFYIEINAADFIKQVFFTQNIFFVYLLVIFLNKKLKIGFNRQYLFVFLFFVFVTFIISRIAVANNNMGRFLHMFAPVLIIDMLYPEMHKLLQKLKEITA